MHSNYLLAAAFFSASVNALPLNINLGAYSPALVVGDGEISFGGKTDVSNLMNALEGAAVAGGAAQANAAPAQQQQTPASPAIVPVTAPAAQGVPDQAAQVTSLQGMGKEIAPRVLQLHQAAAKRDLAGFNAALNYATGALKTGPEVQLGTGAEGSGVGIITRPAGAAVPKGEHKRRDLFSPKMKTTVTTMFVRRNPALEHSEDSNVEKREPVVPVEKREESQSEIDAVNLNMAEGAVAELTFVETREVEEDDE